MYELSLVIDELDTVLTVRFNVCPAEPSVGTMTSYLEVSEAMLFMPTENGTEIRETSDLPETDSDSKIETLIWENQDEWVELYPPIKPLPHRTMSKEQKRRKSIETHFEGCKTQYNALKSQIKALEIGLLQEPFKSTAKGEKAELTKLKKRLPEIEALFLEALKDFNSIQ